MEKVTITLSIEKEKLDALTVFLSEENTTVQKKLESMLRQLYEQTVPDDVRKFVEAKSGSKPKRTTVPAKPRPTVKHTPAVQENTSEHELS